MQAKGRQELTQRSAGLVQDLADQSIYQRACLGGMRPEPGLAL